MGTQISIDSPAARALLKKAVGDTFWVETPKGSTFYEILNVHYINPNPQLTEATHG